ncbi:MAG: carboxylesterase, partial [Erysipelotrichales bacterium]
MKWLDRWFKQEITVRKPVLYCIHGYGVRRTVEFEPLRKYFENLGYRVVTPEIFDQQDEQDTLATVWVKRAEDGLASLLEQNEMIWLVGFSMGGVIASHLAATYKVERLVLLAPAFEYLTFKTVMGKVEEAARSVIKKSDKPASDYPSLPDAFFPVFRETVALCKESITNVFCPVLIIHGTADQTIPVSSSRFAYAKIPHMDKLML